MANFALQGYVVVVLLLVLGCCVFSCVESRDASHTPHDFTHEQKAKIYLEKMESRKAFLKKMRPFDHFMHVVGDIHVLMEPGKTYKSHDTGLDHFGNPRSYSYRLSPKYRIFNSDWDGTILDVHFEGSDVLIRSHAAEYLLRKKITKGHVFSTAMDFTQTRDEEHRGTLDLLITEEPILLDKHIIWLRNPKELTFLDLWDDYSVSMDIQLYSYEFPEDEHGKRDYTNLEPEYHRVVIHRPVEDLELYQSDESSEIFASHQTRGDGFECDESTTEACLDIFIDELRHVMDTSGSAAGAKVFDINYNRATKKRSYVFEIFDFTTPGKDDESGDSKPLNQDQIDQANNVTASSGAETETSWEFGVKLTCTDCWARLALRHSFVLEWDRFEGYLAAIVPVNLELEWELSAVWNLNIVFPLIDINMAPKVKSGSAGGKAVTIDVRCGINMPLNFEMEARGVVTQLIELELETGVGIYIDWDSFDFDADFSFTKSAFHKPELEGYFSVGASIALGPLVGLEILGVGFETFLGYEFGLDFDLNTKACGPPIPFEVTRAEIVGYVTGAIYLPDLFIVDILEALGVPNPIEDRWDFQRIVFESLKGCIFNPDPLNNLGAAKIEYREDCAIEVGGKAYTFSSVTSPLYYYTPTYKYTLGICSVVGNIAAGFIRTKLSTGAIELIAAPASNINEESDSSFFLIYPVIPFINLGKRTRVNLVCSRDLPAGKSIISNVVETTSQFVVTVETASACPTLPACTSYYKGIYYDFSSLELPKGSYYSITSSTASYKFNLCARLQVPNECDSKYSGACQNGQISTGEPATTVSRVSEGTFQLQYSNGDTFQVKLYEGRSTTVIRKTIILFRCNANDIVPRVTSCIEDPVGTYTITIWTSLACEQSVQSGGCSIYKNNQLYDLTPLALPSNQAYNNGDYYFNICGATTVCGTSGSPVSVCKKVGSEKIPLGYLSSTAIRNYGNYRFSFSYSSQYTSLITNIYVKCNRKALTPKITSTAGTEDGIAIYMESAIACPNLPCTFQKDGIIYDFSKLALPDGQSYNFTSGKYFYQLNVCANALNTTCPTDDGYTGICEKDTNSGTSYNLGAYSTQILPYSGIDGTFKLNYKHGVICGPTQLPRETDVILQCNPDARFAFISRIDALNGCKKVVYLDTLLACPPSSCVAVYEDLYYDFSELSRTQGYNFTATTSSVTTNVCSAVTCPGDALSAVCESKNGNYRNLGLPSTTVQQLSRTSYQLSYRYGDQCSSLRQSTDLVLQCSKAATTAAITSFIQDPITCRSTIAMQTALACPQTCLVNYGNKEYDFNGLAKSTSSFYSVTVGNYVYRFNICDRTTSTPCTDSKVGICQTSLSSGSSWMLGISTSNIIPVEQGLFKLSYSDGTTGCSGVKRSTDIFLRCNPSATTPTFAVTELGSCRYKIDVGTRLACNDTRLQAREITDFYAVDDTDEDTVIVDDNPNVEPQLGDYLDITIGTPLTIPFLFAGTHQVTIDISDVRPNADVMFHIKLYGEQLIIVSVGYSPSSDDTSDYELTFDEPGNFTFISFPTTLIGSHQFIYVTFAFGDQVDAQLVSYLQYVPQIALPTELRFDHIPANTTIQFNVLNRSPRLVYHCSTDSGDPDLHFILQTQSQTFGQSANRGTDKETGIIALPYNSLSNVFDYNIETKLIISVTAYQDPIENLVCKIEGLEYGLFYVPPKENNHDTLYQIALDYFGDHWTIETENNDQQIDFYLVQKVEEIYNNPPTLSGTSINIPVPAVVANASIEFAFARVHGPSVGLSAKVHIHLKRSVPVTSKLYFDISASISSVGYVYRYTPSINYTPDTKLVLSVLADYADKITVIMRDDVLQCSSVPSPDTCKIELDYSSIENGAFDFVISLTNPYEEITVTTMVAVTEYIPIEGLSFSGVGSLDDKLALMYRMSVPSNFDGVGYFFRHHFPGANYSSFNVFNYRSEIFYAANVTSMAGIGLFVSPGDELEMEVYTTDVFSFNIEIIEELPTLSIVLPESSLNSVEDGHFEFEIVIPAPYFFMMPNRTIAEEVLSLVTANQAGWSESILEAIINNPSSISYVPYAQSIRVQLNQEIPGLSLTSPFCLAVSLEPELIQPNFYLGSAPSCFTCSHSDCGEFCGGCETYERCDDHVCVLNTQITGNNLNDVGVIQNDDVPLDVADPIEAALENSVDESGPLVNQQINESVQPVQVVSFVSRVRCDLILLLGLLFALLF